MRIKHLFAIVCCIAVLLNFPCNAQITAVTSSHITTCGLNNGSAAIYPSGGSGYTYKWSTGSILDSVWGLAPGAYTVTAYSASGSTTTVYAETFNPIPAWNLYVSTGVNDLAHNYWAISDTEGGQLVGACGGSATATLNGNNTL